MTRSLPTLVLATVLLASCQKKEEAAPAADFVDTRGPEMSEAVSEPAAAPAPPPEAGGSASAEAQRQFARSASLRFRTRSVAKASAMIESIVAANGGYIQLDDLRGELRERSIQEYGTDSFVEISRVDISSTMELRVPNDRLDTVLLHIQPLVLFLDHRTVKAVDVALELRRASRERQRLERAGDRMRDLSEANARLRDRTQADDQALQREDRADAAAARHEDLRAQVDLSSVEVTLYQHPETRLDTLARPLDELWREPFHKRFARAWSDSWSGFATFLLWIASNWILLVLILGAALLFLRFRRNSRNSTEEAPKA